MSAYSTTGAWCGSSDLHREAAGFKPARSAHSLQIREWCQAPDSHREAVRFELTRYSNSREHGGTPPFLSARVWRPELDSNQHRRLRRPSTESVGRGELERDAGIEPASASLATTLPTLGNPHGWSLLLDLNQLPPAYRAGAHPDMSLARDWSGRQDLNLRLPGSGPGCLPG